MKTVTLIMIPGKFGLGGTGITAMIPVTTSGALTDSVTRIATGTLEVRLETWASPSPLAILNNKLRRERPQPAAAAAGLCNLNPDVTAAAAAARPGHHDARASPGPEARAGAGSAGENDSDRARPRKIISVM